jgi:hypothetical protein
MIVTHWPKPEKLPLRYYILLLYEGQFFTFTPVYTPNNPLINNPPAWPNLLQ